MISDRELFNQMTQAATRATEAALAAGHRRDSDVTKKSAYAAALDVYHRERPDEAPTGYVPPAEPTPPPAPTPEPEPEPPAFPVVHDPIFERMDPR